MTKLLFTLPVSGDLAVGRATEALKQAGLRVLRSFDLIAARETHADCSCHHHGTAFCDCQMIVLLVYGSDDSPATLTVHSRDGHTQFALVDDPAQLSSPELETIIIDILLSTFLSNSLLEVHLV